jgi:hypothetical protein
MKVQSYLCGPHQREVEVEVKLEDARDVEDRQSYFPVE